MDNRHLLRHAGPPLSSLTLLTEYAAVFVPLARFPAFIWILCVAFTLPAEIQIPASDARGTAA